MSEMTKNAIIYVRVSSERQVDGYSLDDQEERCKSEAERLGYTVLHVYREEGFSGKTMDRPELEELMNYCQLHHKNVQAFIFYHSSRLSRNTLNYLTLNAFFSKYGITTISVTEPITGDTPETNFLATILSATNQLDNEIKGRNVKNAMKRRFLEGHAIARVPLGYTFKASESTHKEVIRDDQWWEIISEMWRKLEYGFPLLSVSQWISSVSGKHINRSTVASMVTNRFYCGYLCSPTYGEIKGKHEPMISEETFYTVKQMLNGRRTSKTIQRKHNADFAVRGILRCPQGHMMTASWSKGRHKRYAYYFCSTCHSKGIPRNDVENAYTELLTEIVPTDATAKYFKELLTDEYNNQYQALTNTSEWIDKEIKHLNE